MQEYDLSIIIPCLNGGDRISACVGEAMGVLRRYGIKGRVIVADSMSSDNSVQKSLEKGAAVVSTPQKGWGNIVRAAILASKEKYIIICDMHCDCGTVPSFYNALASGKKAVMGNRFADESNPDIPRSCRLYSKIIAKLISLKYGCRIGDMGSGMYGFRRSELLDMKLRSGDRTLLAEILCSHLKLKGTVTELPVAMRRGLSRRMPFCRRGDCIKSIIKVIFS